MIPYHIKRLQLNSRALYFNIQQMQEKGRNDKAAKLKREKDILDACIQEISNDQRQRWSVKKYNKPQ
ncbi:hypothetical protein [Lake Baikal phage Baikal-20-5m-C28]|nr:hypothetical protein [Lake Baikal phage Baikal-20-5m-C28]